MQRLSRLVRRQANAVPVAATDHTPIILPEYRSACAIASPVVRGTRHRSPLDASIVLFWSGHSYLVRPK